jgi:Ca2+-transporting ATPase
VIRNNAVVKVPVEDVVVGDLAVAEEGSLLAADGVIVQSNDFSVNESILTGEAFAVARNMEDPELANVSKGTQVVSGLAVYRVTAVGKGTQLGKISTSLAEIEVPPHRCNNRSRASCATWPSWAWWSSSPCGSWPISRSGSLLDSLLTGFTLAMSILPEEIPVAFATFLALGAWRLAKQGVIVKRSTTVETLGFGHRHLHGQDRHHHRESHDAGAALCASERRNTGPDEWSEARRQARDRSRDVGQ